MKIKPLISVILPVYNGGVCLEASIQSILKQDFQEFEFIVVNDGSSDNTKEIINSFDNSKIRYFENKVNQGIVRSLNWGLHLSNGKFIARMDSGDIAYTSRFSKQIEYLIKNPKIDIVSSCMSIKNLGIIQQYELSDEHISVLLLFGNPLFHPTVMMNRESLRKHNLFYDKNARFCEDYKLWIDSKLSGLQIRRSADVLLEYNFGNDSISYINNYEQKLNALALAYTYSCVYFPNFLMGKRQLFSKLAMKQRLVDQDRVLVNEFAEAFIFENKKLKIFDHNLFSGCIQSCLNFQL